MSGCLDNCSCRTCCGCCCEDLCDKLSEVDWGKHRNFFAAVFAGLLFFVGWWFAIDMAATMSTNNAYFVVGVGSTLAFFMVNAISANQIDSDLYQEGCVSGKCARLWLFVGFLITFACLVGSASVLWIEISNTEGSPSVTARMTPPTVPYVARNTSNSVPSENYTSPTLHIPSTSGAVKSSFVTNVTAVNISTTAMTVAKSKTDFVKVWPGTAIFLQNVFIFIGSMIFKFGRSEEFY